MATAALKDLVPNTENDPTKQTEPEDHGEGGDGTQQIDSSPDEENLERPDTPSDLEIPSFLVNFPSTMDNRVANNIWIKELKGKDKKVDIQKAESQWFAIYNFLAANSLVYVLPSAGNLQDLVWVSNVGMVIPHLKRPTLLLAKFTSPPRKKEPDVARDFFEIWNKWGIKKYDISTCLYRWEGQAEIEWLHDNIYVGGYGERTEIKAYHWMSAKYDMSIIPVKQTSKKLYHNDCTIFNVAPFKTMVCTEVYDKKEIEEIGKYTEIIPVTEKQANNGITNCIRCRNVLLCGSDLPTLKRNDPEYKDARDMVDRLTDISVENGMEPKFFNISEATKAGACVSCMSMNLSWSDYKKSIL